jgi:hypothetical protein
MTKLRSEIRREEYDQGLDLQSINQNLDGNRTNDNSEKKVQSSLEVEHQEKSDNLQDESYDDELREEEEESFADTIHRQARRIVALENVVIGALSGAEPLNKCLNDVSESLMRAAQGSNETVNQLISNQCKAPLRLTERDMMRINYYMSIECLTEAVNGSGSTSLGYRDYNWGKLDRYNGESVMFKHILKSMRSKVSTAIADKDNDLALLKKHNLDLKSHNESLRILVRDGSKGLSNISAIAPIQQKLEIPPISIISPLSHNDSSISKSAQLSQTFMTVGHPSEVLTAHNEKFLWNSSVGSPHQDQFSVQSEPGPASVLESMKRAQLYRNSKDEE